MHSAGANPDIIQAANQAQELARLARQERMAMAFQAVSAVNMVILTGTAAIHLIRDIRRAERDSVWSR
jgi:hypothetical protein